MGGGLKMRAISIPSHSEPPLTPHTTSIMVGRPKSIARKRAVLFRIKTTNSKKAVILYGANKRGGGKKGAVHFTSELCASASTILRHASGGRSIGDFNALKRLLTVGEEELLVEQIEMLSDRGFPPTQALVGEMATALARRRRPTYKGVGVNWVAKFLVRKDEQLTTYWSSPLDRSGAGALNPTAVRQYFDTMEDLIRTYNIKPSNMYGFNEMGLMLSVAPKNRVIARTGLKVAHQRRDGNRELVTVVPTICGDGTILKPTIVFKGVRMNLDWGRVNPLKAQ